ncbi:MAG: DNA primase [Parvularculaceae bacterium]|nr:DNA primase [Parvularculaceae bacterium]
MPRFTPDFLDELRSRLNPSDLIGRSVKLQKRGNAYWGLSPFKKEKTPSFTVDDNRRSYHCFATGNHGDIIKFLTETQGLTFPEAVEQLAEEAGLEIPTSSPQAELDSKRRKGLIEACEEAAKFFASQLRRSHGRHALDYLIGRAINDDLIEVFQLGYAPNDRTALKDHLINKGFREETLIEAGLAIKPDDGSGSYDRFRNRVMFPILGVRNQTIAFGGRALEADARAKYMNSPETPLFHKSDVLYNYGAARSAAVKSGEPLLVCEGYMDVIALSGAGFRTAVAPLGTALTDQQLALLWRQSDEPILCFDGDKAGIAAAHRSVDRALPLLKPGKSLRFVFLPDGKDPDDLVRQNGAEAFAALLAKPEGLADVLWARETAARPLDTPERRAALRSHLRALVRGIADKDVRNAYGADLAARLQVMFAPMAPMGREDRQRQRQGSRQLRRGKNEEPIKASLNLKRAGGPTAFRREASLVLGLLRRPEMVEAREDEVSSLKLSDSSLQALLTRAIGLLFADPGLDSESLAAHLRKAPEARTLQQILDDETLQILKFLRPGAELNEVERGWMDALRRHWLATDAQAELAETAAQSFTDGADKWRAAVKARDEAASSGAGKGADEEGEASAGDLLDRLEKMKATVSARRQHR